MHMATSIQAGQSANHKAHHTLKAYQENQSTLIAMDTGTDSELCLRRLVLELKDVTDVHTLGVHLGLTHARLTAIRESYPLNVEQQRSGILNTWLEADPDKSWSKLVQALTEMSQGAIARKIADKYCPHFSEFVQLDPLVAEARMKLARANEVITTLIAMANELDVAHSYEQLKRISSTLSSGKVQMGLVGLTNSGKSTSLNALMGMDILPSSFQRQTVSSVCIQHKPHSQGELFGRKIASEELALLASGVGAVRSFISGLNEYDRENDISYADLVLHAPVLCLAEKKGVDLEIYDTPGTSEAGSSSVVSVWKTALNNLAAIVLIISADYVFEVSQATLLEKIRALHPRMMEKQSRMLVLVSKYDMCFDGNRESWSPAQLRDRVASHIKVPAKQIVLFSATSALKARKWKQTPSSVDEDSYGKVYYELRHTPEKDSIVEMREYSLENVKKLAEALERFSHIQEIEAELLAKLCTNGPSILLESAVDDSLREVAKLKEVILEKIKAIDVDGKSASVADQEALVKKVDEQLEIHCKKKVDTSLPNLVLQAFGFQLNAIVSTIESHIVATASGKVVSLRGDFDNRDHIHQRVLTVRNEMCQIGQEKIHTAWDAGLKEMRARLTAQLSQLVQEFKQDVTTAHLTDYLNFDSIDPSKLVESLSFPAVQQPDYSQCADVSDDAMNNLIVPQTVTRYRNEPRTTKGERKYVLFGPKETIHYTEVVSYQVTVYGANINGLNGAFQQLASFTSSQVRSLLEKTLEDLTRKLSQVIWEDLQQFSNQPLLRLQNELETRKKALHLGKEAVDGLEDKNRKLCQAESDLQKYL